MDSLSAAPKIEVATVLEEEDVGDPLLSSSSKGACDNDQTVKGCMTKRGRIDSKAHPTFTKKMKRSHVCQSFALSIPEEFCRSHMPTHDADVTLEDEDGEKCIVKFMFGGFKRFSGGWKGFSVAHNLVEGDVLVFHLLRHHYFKVYITRVNNPNSIVSANEDLGPLSRPLVERLQESTDCRKQPKNVDANDEEEDSSSSSSKVSWKPPSARNNITGSSKKVSRKRKNKQVAKYQTSWRCTTKKGRVIKSEAHTLAWKSAVKLQKSLWLSSKHPSFIKQMQHSHVIRLSAALAIPSGFAKRNLPTHDAEVTLDDDESGKSYIVKFVGNERKRFVGGWKAFSDEHKLDIGDVLVFHLLRDCYFKVYIVRVNDPTVAETTNLANTNVHANEEFAGKKKRKCEEPQAPNPEPDHTGTEILHSSDQDADASDLENLRKTAQFPPESVQACLLSGSGDDFDKFRTKVKEIIDPQLISRSILFSYYKLCCSSKSFLHDNLLKNVSRTMAAEIFKETVEVADAIRTYKISTSEDDISMWTRTLEGFGNLGMDVGFLLDRLKKLVSLASEYNITLKEQANAPW